MATMPEPCSTIAPAEQGRAVPRVDANAGLLIAYVVLCTLSLLPFVLIAHPPIVDFANHAARLSLACNPDDPAVAAMYRYNFGIIPNLAADLINWPLCGVMGPIAVLKAVITGSLALVYFSGWLIQRKLFGQANAFLLLLPAFAMNIVTSMGYINFLVGAAIACLMVALFVGRERRFGELLTIGNACGLILFFCHIFALALGAVLFLGFMLRDAPRNARGVLAAGMTTAAMFALPLILVPLVPSASEALRIDYIGKGRAVAALFMTQHSNPSIFGMLLFIPLYLAMRKGWVRLERTMWWPLGTLAAYVTVVPSGLQEAIDIDARTMVALAWLFFASLRIVDRQREICAVVVASSATLVAFSLLMAALVWQPFSRQVDEFRKLDHLLPAKALVLSVAPKDPANTIAGSLAYGHITSYATLDRRIFNPMDFTGVGMQPLRATPAFEPYDIPHAMPFDPATAAKLADPTPAFEKKIKLHKAEFAERWPERFDYVIYYHFGKSANFDPARLEIVARGSYFSILKIKRRPTAL
jgi:hypothetical protein